MNDPIKELQGKMKDRNWIDAFCPEIEKMIQLAESHGQPASASFLRITAVFISFNNNALINRVSTVLMPFIEAMNEKLNGEGDKP